ncbi:hydroxyethylthiazole kinase [Polycladidibacter stylochi]|uniref:hydroxyethylthiazole kinase n=1 Tax=Polycladidibacter stylochi TaxID=1807766 RepID=UPI0008315FBF|nr:hydroxyethylthiazole kinase [Pseudovibrio stylochi]
MYLIDNSSQVLAKLRQTAPLVHNMTNIVVANTTANALLALGASPAMVDGPIEAPELAAVAAALVVNVGTVTPAQGDAMLAATKAAHDAGRPWVLDPVAVGALSYRTELCKQLLANKPAVIRGNASEIMALAGASSGGKGVDSTDRAEAALASAQKLALASNAVVAVSGACDYITDGERVITVANGDAMMPYVTGLGCTATALTGATLAVCDDALLAAAYALLYLGLAGELAAQNTAGPASLQTDIINGLYHLNENQITQHGRIRFYETQTA